MKSVLNVTAAVVQVPCLISRYIQYTNAGLQRSSLPNTFSNQKNRQRIQNLRVDTFSN